MFRHFIIMGSSYKKGSRIALHYNYDVSDISEVSDAIETINNAFDGKAAFSTNCLSTDSPTWESVAEYDPFFRNIEVIESLNEFIWLLTLPSHR